MPFHSKHPPIDLPTKESIFSFFFNSTHSPLSKPPAATPGGYVDAFTRKKLTFQEVKTHATHLSTAFHTDLGIQPGDTVALFSQNSIWYPVAIFAVLRIGGVVSSASPAYNVEEMTYALKTSKAKFLITTFERLDVARAAAENVGMSKDKVIVLEGRKGGYLSLEELIEKGRSGEQVGEMKIGKQGNGKVCAFLSFSSGTTGLPKAVMISHQNVIAQCLQVIKITPELQRVLAVLPLFHITGLVHILHLPILLNATVIMLPTFTMKTMLDAITTFSIQELLLVPPLLIRMVRDPLVSTYDLSQIRRFSSGAAPLSEEIILQLQQKFPNTGFKQGYGMTESCSCITAHPPSHYDYKYAHAVGLVVPSTSIKIIKPDGSEAAIGEPGEIWAKGPQIVMGYLDNETATKETFDAEGYLHTGDQGSIDSEGLVTISDRIKEMIKVKGIGVAPAELEDLLLGHPKVEDVAVLGVADDYAGELPKAYVVLKPGVLGGGDDGKAQEVGRELLEYVWQRKVRHKHVKEVEFVDVIPKSASGKILRRVLRDRERAVGEKGVVVRDAVKEKAML